MTQQSAYRNYLLIILMMGMAFNTADQLALGLMLQDIKTAFALTDTELGLLTGIAFALLYSLMGVPFAWWADRGNRVKIITVAMLIWSAALVLCGAAGTFVQLLLIRVAVGVGEAGYVPAVHSLAADYFNRAERPRAVSRYMLGVPMSVVIGYLAAGWLNEFYGWRATFVALGLPGIALAALVWCTLREPRHAGRTLPASGAADASSRVPSLSLETSSAPGLKEVWKSLWGNATFRGLLFGYTVFNFFGVGIMQWQASFFIRTYHLRTGELGTWFTVIGGVASFLGTYLGGELASRHGVRNEPKQLRAIGILYCAYGVLTACAFLSRNQFLAFGFMVAAAVGVSMTYGPIFALMQSIVPPRMRAMSIALVYLFANLIGIGFGPLVAGAFSDALRPLVGEESLRCGLLIFCVGFLWAGWHLWRASRTVIKDLGRLVHPRRRHDGKHSQCNRVTQTSAVGQ